MEKRHILICGERGAGKSTLIERLLREYQGPVYGYFTRSTPRDENGFHSIYIHPAGAAKRLRSEANHIGDCNGRERSVNLRVFETLGVEYLRHGGDGLIVMDELGFMEAGANDFCNAVLNCLAEDTHVIACVKARFDVPFLCKVRSCPKGELYAVTPENREELYYELTPIVRGWSEA